MGYVIWLSTAILILFALAAWIAVWSRQESLARLAAVILFLVGIPAIAGVGIESLGWHKPVALSWDLKPGDHRVLAAKMVQDQAIYLYLDDPARMEPRPIALAWSNELANRIQQLQEQAAPDANGQFVMRYEPSLDVHAPQFHPLPQPPALPPKPRPDPGLRFEQDA